ncbi:unnamed protein product [Aphanomyces euteiches]
MPRARSTAREDSDVSEMPASPVRATTSSRKRSVDFLDGSFRRNELIRVEGRRGCFNDLYLSIAPQARANVVFFPGDVQHFDHVMRRGAFKSFASFSYESMSAHYARRFPEANIWIIKPSVHVKGVSCYDNFIDNVDGNPSEYLTDGCAFLQLQLLMEHACSQFPDQTLSWDLPLHLLGFSRGAIVLNQLITELGSLLHLSSSPTQVEVSLQDLARGDSISAFFERVESIEWIDGGCNVPHMTFPTNESSLVVFDAFQHIQLRVLVTPYHMESPHRPWYADDVAAFEDSCSRVVVTEHFMDDEPSLRHHFDVLFID